MNQTVTVNITALDGTALYSQTVESLDLVGVINAVNKPLPPPAPKKKVRSDAGKPRKVTQPLGI
jgi:hypothetical protein